MSEENLINLNPQRVKNRRVKVFGLMAVSTFLATLKWMTVIPTDSWWLTKFLMVALFILTFAWIALFFWSSVFGFIELLKGSKVPGIRWVPEETRLSSKVAVLMPVYNESSQGVFANLLAMGNDLVKTGQGKAFDFFVLSDTTNPKVWVEEEKTWLEAKKLMPEEINQTVGVQYDHKIIFGTPLVAKILDITALACRILSPTPIIQVNFFRHQLFCLQPGLFFLDPYFRIGRIA